MSARTGVVGKFGKLINSVGACGAFGKSASLMNWDPESPACDSLLQDESGASSSVLPIQTWQAIVHYCSLLHRNWSDLGHCAKSLDRAAVRQRPAAFVRTEHVQLTQFRVLGEKLGAN
jgi:hypothetical protein